MALFREKLVNELVEVVYETIIEHDDSLRICWTLGPFDQLFLTSGEPNPIWSIGVGTDRDLVLARYHLLKIFPAEEVEIVESQSVSIDELLKG